MKPDDVQYTERMVEYNKIDFYKTTKEQYLNEFKGAMDHALWSKGYMDKEVPLDIKNLIVDCKKGLGVTTVYSIGFFMISSDKKTKYVGIHNLFFPVENSVFKFSDLDIDYINNHINEFYQSTIKNYIKKLTEPMPIIDKLDDEERNIFKGVF
jgi:hypothetical protein